MANEVETVELADELQRLGYARTADVATAAQGEKADSAVQPAELGEAIATRATAAQGSKADAALPATEVGVSVASLVGGKIPAGQLPAYPGSTDDVPEGPNNKYFSMALARAATLAVRTLANSSIVIGDTFEAMFGKLQAQINALASTKTCIPIACSDETTALTVGTGKVTFRMPFALSGVSVRASLTTAQTSGALLTLDVKEGGVSIFSTKPTFDNTEKTTTTAATPAELSDTTLADDAEITIDISQVGDGTAKGLKVYLLGVK